MELAGLSLSDFMDITRQHGMEWVSYTDEELEAEVSKALALGETAREFLWLSDRIYNAILTEAEVENV